MSANRQNLSESAVLVANQQWQIESRSVAGPLPDECQIRVRAAGVCSSDIKRACGGGAYFYPLVPGHEFCGEIIRVGTRVRSWRVGQRVVVYPLLSCGACASCRHGDAHLCAQYSYYGSRRDGGFQQVLNVRAANLVEIPPGVSFEFAALVEPLSVVVHALEKLRPFATERILICGAGTLGLMAAKVLCLRGQAAGLVVADRNSQKLELCRQHGVRTECLHGEKMWELFASEHEAGFDAVLEFTGTGMLLESAIRMLGPRGALICVGNPSDSVTLSRLALDRMLRKELSVFGSWNSVIDPDWKTAVDLLQQGLDLSPLISVRVGLEELPQTIGRMAMRKEQSEFTSLIKAIVLP